MASSRLPGPLRFDLEWQLYPDRSPGPLGFNDAAAYGVDAYLGDTPGPLGVNDHAEPDGGLLALQDAVVTPRDFTQTLTVEQLGQIVSAEAAAAALEQVNQAMTLGNVNTVARQAAFLAQVSHESAGLTKLKENGGDAYFNRRYGPGTGPGKNVGNTIAGDGARFKGRGMIQLTGRENYTRAWIDFGLPVKKDPKNKLLFRGVDPINPDLAAEPEWSTKFAAWYWDVLKGVNTVADGLEGSKDERATFVLVTKKVNGGTNGFADRVQYYLKAKKVLGITWGNIKAESTPPPRRKGRRVKRKGRRAK